MGYRSVVEAVFYTRNEEEWPILKLYIDENFPKFWGDEDKECLKPIKASNAWGYHFTANNVKWYENYPEIQEFNAFAKKFVEFAESKENMPEEQLGWAFEFVRLGEDTSDIEEERSDNADFILSVSREVQLMP